jgi:hypothetical protein
MVRRAMALVPMVRRAMALVPKVAAKVAPGPMARDRAMVSAAGRKVADRMARRPEVPAPKAAVTVDLAPMAPVRVRVNVVDRKVVPMGAVKAARGLTVLARAMMNAADRKVVARMGLAPKVAGTADLAPMVPVHAMANVADRKVAPMDVVKAVPGPIVLNRATTNAAGRKAGARTAHHATVSVRKVAAILDRALVRPVSAMNRLRLVRRCRPVARKDRARLRICVAMGRPPEIVVRAILRSSSNRAEISVRKTVATARAPMIAA